MPELLLTPYQWFSYLTRNRLRILMYHSISDDPGDPLAVTPARFREEMALLAARGYCGVPLLQALVALTGGDPVARMVGITFDDGFRDFCTDALPVLQQYGFGATLFVVAGLAGQTSRWSSFRKERPLLGWDELRALARHDQEIGSHTLSHPDLITLSSESLQRELYESKSVLQEKLQTSVRAFAYPGGTFGAREISAVAASGYEAAVIVGGRWGNGRETPRLRLKREKMLRRDTLTDFWRKVSGFYEPFLIKQMLGERLRFAVARL
jgi:peptidoglycan/xylan/chitin deacetylase (PgdA/CDA1 family)